LTNFDQKNVHEGAKLRQELFSNFLPYLSFAERCVGVSVICNSNGTWRKPVQDITTNGNYY